MPNIECFLIEKNEYGYLRAVFSNHDKCEYPGNYNYHRSEIVGTEQFSELNSLALSNLAHNSPLPICKCGFQFTIADYYGGGLYHPWHRVDNNEPSDQSVPGAMWWGESYSFNTPEGTQALFVETPGGPWCIDSRASNCTKPEDNEHRCWIRHGEVPKITVDKNGNTCSAGAGSIQAGNYHGFLRDGILVDA